MDIAIKKGFLVEHLCEKFFFLFFDWIVNYVISVICPFLLPTEFFDRYNLQGYG